jgi:hypothetical protein
LDEQRCDSLGRQSKNEINVCGSWILDIDIYGLQRWNKDYFKEINEYCEEDIKDQHTWREANLVRKIKNLTLVINTIFN